MKKPFTIITTLFLIVVIIVCNNSPKNVSGSIFKQEYELGINQTMV